jgi:hypothetical protein
MRRVELQRHLLLAKRSATHGSQLVATSFFSPISSVPNTASSVFLKEDDVPPSNQLEAQKLVVHGTTSLVPPGGLTTTAGGSVTVVRVADGDGIFPALHVANILLCEPWRSRYHGGVGSVTTRR